MNTSAMYVDVTRGESYGAVHVPDRPISVGYGRRLSALIPRVRGRCRIAT